MEIAPISLNYPTSARPIIHVSTYRLLPKTLVLGLSLTLCGTTTGMAATATTDPVGYNTISLLANSDTYVSVPFHRPAAFVGQVSSFSGNVITVAGTPGWTASQFVYASGTQSNTYYLFIRSGTKEGNYYTVTANAANTLTIDLAGDTLTGLAANDSISVIPYWTLGTLFPNTDVGVSFTASVAPGVALTEIQIPDAQTAGINLAVSRRYFYYNSAWRQIGQSLSVSKNDDLLVPDSYFIVRNSANSGTLTQTGSVVMQKTAIILDTETSTKQDNAISLIRPIPVTLNQSGLISSGAFAASLSPGARTDELLVYDNTVAAKNKAASARYFYYNNAWRKVGEDLSLDFGSTVVFGPGTGVQIRKGTTPSGASAVWTNTASY